MRQMESAMASGTASPTIVSMQSDYVTDNQLCLTSVSFAPPEFADIIYNAIIKPLQNIDPDQYYYPNTSLHVTIHNIRVVASPPNFTSADIQKAKTLLSTSIPTYVAPTFTLQGLLVMPTSVAIVALVTPEYDHMVRQLRQTFADAGLPDNKTYFTNEIIFANMTICRYTHKPSQVFLEKIETLKNIDIGRFVVQEVSLIQTNAGAHPTKTKVFGSFNFKPL